MLCNDLFTGSTPASLIFLVLYRLLHWQLLQNFSYFKNLVWHSFPQIFFFYMVQNTNKLELPLALLHAGHSTGKQAWKFPFFVSLYYNLPCLLVVISENKSKNTTKRMSLNVICFATVVFFLSTEETRNGETGIFGHWQRSWKTTKINHSFPS